MLLTCSVDHSHREGIPLQRGGSLVPTSQHTNSCLQVSPSLLQPSPSWLPPAAFLPLNAASHKDPFQHKDSFSFIHLSPIFQLLLHPWSIFSYFQDPHHRHGGGGGGTMAALSTRPGCGRIVPGREMPRDNRLLLGFVAGLQAAEQQGFAPRAAVMR